MMSLSDIYRIFEQRRRDLISILEHNKHMELGKQHQIYGAVLEIETFLKTIEHFRIKEQQEEKFKLKKHPQS